jgi:hypothetical protein
MCDFPWSAPHVRLKPWCTPTMLHDVTSCNTAALTLTANLSDLTQERPPTLSLSPVLCSSSDLPQQSTTFQRGMDDKM